MKKSLGYWNFAWTKKWKWKVPFCDIFIRNLVWFILKTHVFFPSCYNGFSFLLLKIIFKFLLSYF